jgi:hypothetical protein
MRSIFTSNHFTDKNGCPSGGTTYGNGFAIGWQNGPLGRGPEREPANGAFVEDIIAAAIDRLQHYQSSRFNCIENGIAIDRLNDALFALNERTKRREAAGVEGTHGGN